MENSVKAHNNEELSPVERSNIANQVRIQISAHKIDDIIEIRKLKIMLNLFEQYGREFQQCMPVPSLDRRALDVNLCTSKDNSCRVTLRRISANCA